MQTVARFTTAMEAMHFAAFLRASGVGETQIFDKGDPLGGVLGVDVAVHDDDVHRATSLKAEYLASSPQPGKDEAVPHPDLSKLPAAFAPPCPKCGVVLPLAEVAACPACGAAVDVPGLIVEARGPEALEACYDQPEMSEEQAADLNLHCTHCGYPLKGLPAESTCPECGRPFDKRASTSRW